MIGREEVENLAGQNAEKPRQIKNICSSAWKGFEEGRRDGFTHTFRPFSYGQSRLHLGNSCRKTSTASICLASVRSQEQDRHASLPFRSSIVRMAQMVVQWLIQAQWRPLRIKWKVIQRPAVESQVRMSSSAAEVGGFSMARKETNRKRSGEWNGKDLPAMCDKTVPAKTLKPAAFRFGCSRWRVEWSHGVSTKALMPVTVASRLRDFTGCLRVCKDSFPWKSGK